MTKYVYFSNNLPSNASEIIDCPFHIGTKVQRGAAQGEVEERERGAGKSKAGQEKSTYL